MEWSGGMVCMSCTVLYWLARPALPPPVWCDIRLYTYVCTCSDTAVEYGIWNMEYMYIPTYLPTEYVCTLLVCIFSSFSLGSFLSL